MSLKKKIAFLLLALSLARQGFSDVKITHEYEQPKKSETITQRTRDGRYVPYLWENNIIVQAGSDLWKKEINDSLHWNSGKFYDLQIDRINYIKKNFGNYLGKNTNEAMDAAEIYWNAIKSAKENGANAFFDYVEKKSAEMTDFQKLQLIFEVQQRVKVGERKNDPTPYELIDALAEEGTNDTETEESKGVCRHLNPLYARLAKSLGYEGFSFTIPGHISSGFSDGKHGIVFVDIKNIYPTNLKDLRDAMDVIETKMGKPNFLPVKIYDANGKIVGVLKGNSTELFEGLTSNADHGNMVKFYKGKNIFSIARDNGSIKSAVSITTEILPDFSISVIGYEMKDEKGFAGIFSLDKNHKRKFGNVGIDFYTKIKSSYNKNSFDRSTDELNNFGINFSFPIEDVKIGLFNDFFVESKYPQRIFPLDVLYIPKFWMEYKNFGASYKKDAFENNISLAYKNKKANVSVEYVKSSKPYLLDSFSVDMKTKKMGIYFKKKGGITTGISYRF